MIRLLIAEDHTIVRQGIKALFDATEGFEVVAEASDGAEAIRKAGETLPDVVVMNLDMPVMNGIEATRHLKNERPDLSVVILTVHDEERYVFQSLKAGATGYILKTASFNDLREAVRSAHAGTPRFSPTISRKIMESYLGEGEASDRRAEKRDRLTPRERDVLQLIAQGNTNAEIARGLKLSIKTVETHRTNMMKKLDVHDVASLTMYAIRAGLVILER